MFCHLWYIYVYIFMKNLGDGEVVNDCVYTPRFLLIKSETWPILLSIYVKFPLKDFSMHEYKKKFREGGRGLGSDNYNFSIWWYFQISLQYFQLQRVHYIYHMSFKQKSLKPLLHAYRLKGYVLKMFLVKTKASKEYVFL